MAAAAPILPLASELLYAMGVHPPPKKDTNPHQKQTNKNREKGLARRLVGFFFLPAVKLTMKNALQPMKW